MTRNEQEIQTKILQIARAENDKDKRIKVAYRKITIERVHYIWDDKGEGLIVNDSQPKI